MNVARSTVQSIYAEAKEKRLADALVNTKLLRIEGGDYQLCDGLKKSLRCEGCRRHRRDGGLWDKRTKHSPWQGRMINRYGNNIYIKRHKLQEGVFAWKTLF